MVELTVPANTWLSDVDVVGLAATPQGFLYAATPRTVLRGSGYVPVAGEPGPNEAPFALTVYPNPVGGTVSVRFTSVTGGAVADGFVEVVLYDALGRRLRTLYAGPPGAESPVVVDADTDALARASTSSG